MKQFTVLLALFSFLFIYGSCQVVNSAQNKTNREISKKTNKKIEDIFNKDDNKKSPDGNGDNKSDSDNDPNNSDINSNPTQTRNASDFIPGEKIIFIDTLKRELLGEFPSKWDLRTGNIEVMKFEGKNVIGYASGGEIFPLIDKKEYLPEQFTIEFDCYFHNYGNEAYSVNFDKSRESFTVRSDGIYGQSITRAKEKYSIGWRHIAVSFNKRSLKIYYNGERLHNKPNIKDIPNSLSIKALTGGASKGKYAMIKNIRIAEGGVPLYDRLITEGKFVTNDIHFEYNKAELKSESWRTIINVADMMKLHTDVNLRIEGHTDGDGSGAYNLDLSQKRASAVLSALIKEGIPANRLSAKGIGENSPIAPNNTAEGKAMNRRVEFILID